MRFLAVLIQTSLVHCSLHWYTSQTGAVPPTVSFQGDDELVRNFVSQLHSITAANDLTSCVSCKARLQVGKVLSLARPRLVPLVFTTWCLEIGAEEDNCYEEFGYPSDDVTTLGNDFTAMLQMMDPIGYDGDLFCFHHDQTCDVRPEPPIVDLSHLWSPKPHLYEAPHPSGSTFNILHISDIDYQPDYAVLSEANCTQQVCCSESSFDEERPPDDYDYASLYDDEMDVSFHDSTYGRGHFEKGPELHHFGSTEKKWLPAHEFGAYECESPGLLVNNTLQIIEDFHQNQLNFELGILTGGVSSKHKTQHTKMEFLKSQSSVYQSLKHYLKEIPIVPNFGAQDTYPSCQLPQSSSSTSNLYQWQFDFLSDVWYQNKWLDFETSSQVRYSKVGFSLVTPRGLKIISLNSNVWNSDNLYAFIKSSEEDPYGVWKFLIDELLESEENNQRVWVIAHIPPFGKALTVPSRAFTQIIQRFSPKVIAALFFGDSLEDTFNVVYSGDCEDKELENAVNVALTGPSLTPYGGNNPAWRYYAVDKETFDIMDSFTFHTKLNQSFVNNGEQPVWELGELARSFFDPCHEWPSDQALNAEFWHRAATLLKHDPEFNEKFEQLKTRFSSDQSNSENDCEYNYCKTTSFTSEGRKKCLMACGTDSCDERVTR